MELLELFAQKLEENNRKIKIAVFGDCMVDEDYEVKVNRISPESPNVNILRCEKFEPFRTYPGGAANVCYLLKNFNIDVDLYTFVDAKAALFFKQSKIKGNYVYLPDGHNVPRKMRFYEKSSSQFTQRIDLEIPNYGLDNNTIEDLQKHLFKEEINADVVIFSDYNKGLFGDGFSISRVNTSAIKIVDPKMAPLERWVGCDVFKPNSREAYELSGLTDWKEQCDFFKAKLNCGAVIITQEGNGIVGKISDYFEYRPHFHVKPVDIVGAGDSFIATLALAISHGFDVEEAAKIAFHGGLTYVQQKHRGMFGPWSFKAGGKILRNIDFLRDRNYKLVFTNGCFDLLTAAHVRLLEFARSKGDRLIVALNSDRSIQRLKGDDRPIVALEKRMRVLASLECVDFVVGFDEDTPLELIKKIQPDLIVKGGDYQKKDIAGWNVVGEENVVLFPYEDGISTTSIVKTILKNNRS